MIPIITFLIVVILSVLVTRVATIALVHTGLSREAAQFQARSAFTGVGYTTTESERIVKHPAVTAITETARRDLFVNQN